MFGSSASRYRTWLPDGHVFTYLGHAIKLLVTHSFIYIYVTLWSVWSRIQNNIKILLDYLQKPQQQKCQPKKNTPWFHSKTPWKRVEDWAAKKSEGTKARGETQFPLVRCGSSHSYSVKLQRVSSELKTWGLFCSQTKFAPRQVTLLYLTSSANPFHVHSRFFWLPDKWIIIINTEKHTCKLLYLIPIICHSSSLPSPQYFR